jgi:uncharacterized membrane protein YbhN (UPF0104 family)
MFSDTDRLQRAPKPRSDPAEHEGRAIWRWALAAGSRVGRIAWGRRAPQALLAIAIVVAGVGLAVWAPHLPKLLEPFEGVSWRWMAAALACNLVSILVRASAWRVVLGAASPSPPSYRVAFSAYGVGLLGNTVVPGRVGEVARIVTIGRHLGGARRSWPLVAGTVLAQRMLDGLGFLALVVYVLVAARIPDWAFSATLAVLAVGIVSLVAGIVLARRHGEPVLPGLGRLRRSWIMVRQGLSVLRAPGPALKAAALELCGWAAQLGVVWLSLRAFSVHVPLAGAALVLLAVNAVLAFPVWPGGIGLYQAAVALALVAYGIAYTDGFGAGVGVQAVESVVGIAFGLFCLAHEGLSLAQLRQSARAEIAEDVDG